MLRDFDIFENYPDGSTMWRACVFGRFAAERKMKELAKDSNNSFWAIDIQAGELLPMVAGRHEHHFPPGKSSSS